MIIFKSINKLNKEVNFKADIGFVPTMGSLHKGHISLVKNCQKTCDKTLVSIFINPSQFNRKTDYKNYPRTLDKDIKILKKLKVDYVLVPNIKEIYSRNTPRKININKKVNINRPLSGSFANVCTEFKIPERTKKVPHILKVKTAIDKTITQELKASFFS